MNYQTATELDIDTAPIASRENKWFRRFKVALESHEEEIVLEGPKQIGDAIRLGWDVIAVAESADRLEPSSHFADRYLRFDKRLLNLISDTKSSQGILGLFERPAARMDVIFERRSTIVVLDAVQDPGNVGTAIRNAAAFEAAGVILTEGCADPFAPKSIRASAGAVLAMPLWQTTRAALLEAAVHNDIPMFATAGAGDGSVDEIPDAALIVFGNEGQGVSHELLARSKRVRIPISGLVESLNVASAAAVVLAEMHRRRSREPER
ncbi:MAG TPA: RNA methyltransferase [Thermoanaerobaculia bacterium]|nr:RNA methyltransferase [Thermoanaerobaculia bacterium]